MFKAFFDLSTKAKLLSCFIVVIVLNAVVTLTAIISIYNVQSVAVDIESLSDVSMKRTLRFQHTIIATDTLFLSGLNDQDSSVSFQSFRAQAPTAVQNMNNIVKELTPESINPHVAEMIPGYRDTVLQIRADLQKFLQAVEALRPIITQAIDGETSKEDALGLYLIEVHTHAMRAIEDCSKVVSLQAQYSTMMAKESADPTAVYMSSALAVFSIVFALFCAVTLSNYMSRSLGKQVDCLRALSQGDFSKVLKTNTKDEFGECGRMLETMRSSINGVLTTVNSACDRLQGEMTNLHQLSQEISTSSADVQTQSVAVAAASDEMVSTTSDIARNCETAAAGANECQDMTAHSVTQVQSTVENIRQQAEQTKDNAAKVETLAQQTNKIGSIVSTIDEIAAQTNLLALNAAIEAARAGEAGRGFAVVADEVRALASRTTDSTKEISDMIKTVQSEAKVATDAIASSVSEMDAIAEAAHNIMTILDDVSSRVTNVTGQITQIATAAEEQTTATSEISNNMQKVSGATTNMSNDAQNQIDAMGQANNELQKLRQALSFFKNAHA